MPSWMDSHMKENVLASETQTGAPAFGRGRSWAQVMERYGILVVFLLLVVASALLSPVFLRPANILNVLRQISITGVIALGMTFVILTAGIDLSVGSVDALVTVLAASFLRLGLVPVLLLGLAVGSAMGLINGVGIAMGRISPLIMTLAMMYMGRGLAYAGQLGIGVALAGLGYELSAIAAVVIGGTSLFGGQGSVFGTFLGAAIVGVTNNLLNLMGIDPLVQDFMKGLIILAAVLINRRRT